MIKPSLPEGDTDLGDDDELPFWGKGAGADPFVGRSRRAMMASAENNPVSRKSAQV